MANDRAARLAPVVEMAQKAEREAARLMGQCQAQLAQRFKQLWSRYQQSRDLISVGAYVAGGDADTDLAIARQPAMARYLHQGLNESEPLAQSVERLAAVLNTGNAG